MACKGDGHEVCVLHAEEMAKRNEETDKSVLLDARVRLRRLEVARKRAEREHDQRRVEALEDELDALRREILEGDLGLPPLEDESDEHSRADSNGRPTA